MANGRIAREFGVDRFSRTLTPEGAARQQAQQQTRLEAPRTFFGTGARTAPATTAVAMRPESRLAEDLFSPLGARTGTARLDALTTPPSPGANALVALMQEAMRRIGSQRTGGATGADQALTGQAIQSAALGPPGGGGIVINIGTPPGSVATGGSAPAQSTIAGTPPGGGSIGGTPGGGGTVGGDKGGGGGAGGGGDTSGTPPGGGFVGGTGGSGSSNAPSGDAFAEALAMWLATNQPLLEQLERERRGAEERLPLALQEIEAAFAGAPREIEQLRQRTAEEARRFANRMGRFFNPATDLQVGEVNAEAARRLADVETQRGLALSRAQLDFQQFIRDLVERMQGIRGRQQSDVELLARQLLRDQQAAAREQERLALERQRTEAEIAGRRAALEAELAQRIPSGEPVEMGDLLRFFTSLPRDPITGKLDPEFADLERTARNQLSIRLGLVPITAVADIIRQSRAAGLSDQAILARLRREGYPEPDIAAAFAAAGRKFGGR